MNPKRNRRARQTIQHQARESLLRRTAGRCYSFLKRHPVMAAISAVFAIVSPVVSTIGSAKAIVAPERIASAWSSFHHRHFHKRPFPSIITADKLATMSSGELELAELQIQAWNGVISDDVKGPRSEWKEDVKMHVSMPWIEHCLRSPFAFPSDHQTQYFDRGRMELDDLDRQNLALIGDRLFALTVDRKEEDSLLSIGDPYGQYLGRSQKQLLHTVDKKGRFQLSEEDYYLLRNEIYAVRGRQPGTARLARYYRARGYKLRPQEFTLNDMKPIEICNAFYLAQKHQSAYPDSTNSRFVYIPFNQDRRDYAELDRFAEALCVALPKNPHQPACLQGQSDLSKESAFSLGADLVLDLHIGTSALVTAENLTAAAVTKLGGASETMRGQRHGLSNAAKEIQAAIGPLDAAPPSTESQCYIGLDLVLPISLLNGRLKTADGLDELAGRVSESLDKYIGAYGNAFPVSEEYSMKLKDICSVSTTEPRIIEKLLQFDSTRQSLSLEYMKRHHGIAAKVPVISPQMVVIHWTATDTKDAAFSTMDPPTLPASRAGLQEGGKLNVSAHYLVDRDGTIYRLFPDNRFARHVIGLNHCAIGIENVGGRRADDLTEEQLISNEALVRMLVRKYPSVRFLIGHHEYQGLRGSPLWKELDARYKPTKKIDPGPRFMGELRGRLKDVALLSQYEPTHGDSEPVVRNSR